MSWSRKPEPVAPPLKPDIPSELDNVTDAVITEIANRILKVKELTLSAQEIRIAMMLGRGMTMKDISREMNFRHPSDIANRVRTCCRRNEITRHKLAVYGAFLAMRKGDL